MFQVGTTFCNPCAIQVGMANGKSAASEVVTASCKFCVFQVGMASAKPTAFQVGTANGKSAASEVDTASCKFCVFKLEWLLPNHLRSKLERQMARQPRPNLIRLLVNSACSKLERQMPSHRRSKLEWLSANQQSSSWNGAQRSSFALSWNQIEPVSCSPV